MRSDRPFYVFEHGPCSQEMQCVFSCTHDPFCVSASRLALFLTRACERVAAHPRKPDGASRFLVRVLEALCRPRLESTDALKQRIRFDKSRDRSKVCWTISQKQPWLFGACSSSLSHCWVRCAKNRLVFYSFAISLGISKTKTPCEASVLRRKPVWNELNCMFPIAASQK